jgi:16S rRNA (cytosine967-C5)-methyltransferase
VRDFTRTNPPKPGLAKSGHSPAGRPDSGRPSSQWSTSKPSGSRQDASAKSQPPASPAPRRFTPHSPPREVAGLAVRELAVAMLVRVLYRSQVLDEALVWAFASERGQALSDRDKAFVRVIVATVLRRHGELSRAITAHLEKPLPEDSGRLWPILLSAAAQLLILETPPHAAISLAVDQTRLDAGASRFSKLTNAVLRRVSEAGRGETASELNIQPWLMARWRDAYGPDVAARIADASLEEAALDITVKSDAAAWAPQLGGTLLPTGSIRLASAGRIEALAGYSDGAWWVQDAAASIPAQLFGPLAGKDVADLCAAPGGKTAQLASLGAQVTAVDLRPERLRRVDQNMARLGLRCETVAADVSTWSPGRTFDAVLLDAPCTATGTIRRHPDILHLKRETDAASLAPLQARLLNNAAHLVSPGGTLMYCVCSLEASEGVAQVSSFLEAHPDFHRQPIQPGEAGVEADWLTVDGDLRTFPFHLEANETRPGGLDGFYVARLKRRSSNP